MDEFERPEQTNPSEPVKTKNVFANKNFTLVFWGRSFPT